LLLKRRSIPAAYYEIARQNSASGWLVFKSITWPLMRNVVGALILLRFAITAMKFDVPWLVYAGLAQSDWADTFPIIIYRYAFERLWIGRASMASMMLLLIVMSLLLFFMRKRREVSRV
jgi:ABC-type sugar transport system permease subunit